MNIDSMLSTCVTMTLTDSQRHKNGFWVFKAYESTSELKVLPQTMNRVAKKCQEFRTGIRIPEIETWDAV